MELDNSAVAEVGTASPLAQWVVFSCCGRRYGVALGRVQEIVTPRPFTRLPGTGPAVAGLMGLRSRVITVYDAGVLLGQPAARERADHRILLVEVEARTVGLVVEEVCAVAPLELEASEPGDAVLGAGEWGGSAVETLDVDRLLQRAGQRDFS